MVIYYYVVDGFKHDLFSAPNVHCTLLLYMFYTK